jgi:hypothetical protein
VNNNGPIPGRRPVFIQVGDFMPFGQFQSVEITQIDYDADLRRFMVSLATQMLVSIPYSDEAEIIYYDKEQHGRNIQSKRKQEDF